MSPRRYPYAAKPDFCAVLVDGVARRSVRGTALGTVWGNCVGTAFTKRSDVLCKYAFGTSEAIGHVQDHTKDYGTRKNLQAFVRRVKMLATATDFGITFLCVSALPPSHLGLVECRNVSVRMPCMY